MADERNAVSRFKSSADPQVAAMISNPAEYFARARAAARREAENYVRNHERRWRAA